MPELELSAGTIEYEDTGGAGPAIVFSHGLFMDGSQWRHVVAELRADYRCVLPTLPLGAHRHPMRPDADLSMRGIAGLLGELIERLDLRDLTLAMSDWGGPQLLIGSHHEARIARLIICSCEAFDNVPPKGTAKALPYIARLPGGMAAVVFPFRFDALRRLPRAHGRRLAELLPHGRLVEIEGSRTLITEDQPARLTAHIREFLRDTSEVAA